MADIIAALPVEPRAISGARAALRACRLAAIVSRLVILGRAERGVSPVGFAHRAQRTANAILDAHGVRVTVSGRVPGAPALIVANHLSYLDPLVVASVAPCVSIAKTETVDWPLIGAGLRALGVVFVRRADPYSGAVALRRAGRALRDGASVLNFPEGTTCDGSEVGSFRRGVFGLARLAGKPIVPARISYGDDRVPWYGGETFVPHYAKVAGLLRVTARVSFGEPLWPRDSGGCSSAEAARDLASRARDAVASLPAIA
jgi:1-acyl-sn-glycerol-3-phosphate acyltransferase